MADTNQTERVGVNAVEAIFLSMGWIFREQTISDFGIDAHVEPKDDGIPTGQLIALQIKRAIHTSESAATITSSMASELTWITQRAKVQ